MKIRVRFKNSKQDHIYWINKKFQCFSNTWKLSRSNDIGHNVSYIREMLNEICFPVKLLERQQWKRFLHRFVTRDEKWLIFIIQSTKNHGCILVMLLCRKPRIFTASRLYSVFYGINSVNYELLKLSEKLIEYRYQT